MDENYLNRIDNEKKELMAKKYRITMNIDTDTVSWIRSETKDFDAIEITSKDETWAHEVIEIIRKLENL